MKFTHPRFKVLVLALALAAGQVYGQSSTSSALSGRVTDPEGKPVAGATVVIKHVPSGTTRTVTTDDEGRYGSQGLRVGGPFEVTVTADGYEAVVRDDLSLKLGQVQSVNLVVESDASELDAVEVTGTATASVFDQNRMGASTSVSREQIDSLPSVRRSLDDYIRLDPRIVQVDKDRGGLSAGGQNNRYNNITIDGVSANDEFGLNDSGFPALNQPISLDAIEAIDVAISSFDVTQADFTGANINAVTKSGTNEFKGSVYSYYRKPNWVGEDDNGNNFRGFQSELTYGGVLGGPIIQDTLFFFVNYESFKSKSAAPTVNQRVLNGQLSQIISDADLAAARTALTGIGYTLGSAASGVDNEDEKIIAKIDWNVSDQHRASFRYQSTEGSILRTPDVGNNTVSFSDHWYTDNIDNESYTGQFYSDWTPSFSTEFSVARNEYSSIPQNRVFFPQVQIGFNNNADSLVIGTERSRQSNILEANTTTGYGNGTLFLGDHTLKFGADWKKNEVFNLFIQDSSGTYNARSIADLQANRFSRYRYRFTPLGGIDTGAAQFDLANFGLFLQDTWLASPNLTITAGVRIDAPDISDTPQFNQSFFNAFGLRNDSTIDGNEIVQPRMGFNYTFDGERRMQLRGGLGLFAGSSPNVWMSNAFTNNGVTITGFDITNPAVLVFNGNPATQPRPTGTPLTPNIDVISPDFEQPSIWKANLAFETELPVYGLIGSAEIIQTETNNNVFYEHLNLGNAVVSAVTPNGLLPDGRLNFWANPSATGFVNPASPNSARRGNRNPNFNDVLLLRNTNKGFGTSLTLALEKPMQDNWYGKIAYTYGDGSDVNPGTSSVAFSNFQNRSSFNPNEEIASQSNYTFDDRITAIFNYRMNFIEGLPTEVGFFYEGRTGRGFSYTFVGDANGDNISGNDLFYVPTGPGDVTFVASPASGTRAALTAQEAEAAFFSYIESNEYLDARRGQVVGRNGENSPWVSQIDVRISQELPMVWNVKGRVFLDIQNFGNLLRDSWGQIDEASFPYNVQVARFAGVGANGRYQYQFLGEPQGFVRQDRVGQSRWAAQIGLRFDF